MNFFARSGLPYTLLDANTAVTGYGASFPVSSVTGFVQGGCSNGLSQCVPGIDSGILTVIRR